MAIPRALSPAGVVLVDKEAGPSSFAIVARLRSRTGARAGHAGTLDPFATGLLLVFLGAATKVVQRFVGLDKRYVTDVDLAAREHDRRPEGSSSAARAAGPRVEALLDGLRGEVELPVPASSAVKIGGRARLHAGPRAAPRWRCRCGARSCTSLELVSYDGRVRAARHARRSGTYVRAIADGAGRALRDAAPHRGRAVPGRGGRRGADRAVDEALARL